MYDTLLYFRVINRSSDDGLSLDQRNWGKKDDFLNSCDSVKSYSYEYMKGTNIK